MDDREPPALAYLVSRYPATSQTFIRQEIAGLRRRGWTVHAFSVHRVDPDALVSAADRAEYERTTPLLPTGLGTVVAATLAVVRACGFGLARLTGAEVVRNLRAGRGIRSVAYVVEAVLLWHAVSRLGVRHIHTHFSNVATDVARLACLVQELDHGGPAWTWSNTVHGPTEFYDARRFDLATKFAQAPLTIAISHYARSQVLALGGPADDARVPIVHCGVDTERFSSGAATTPVTESRADTRPMHVSFVGRLVPEKGPDRLVRAAAILRDQGVDVRMRLAGDGPQRPSLDRLVDELDLAGHVELLGAIPHEDVVGLHRWADVFCLPSYAEGVPVVLMEAMGMGLPVVSTAINGIPELVEDGHSGLLVPPSDVDALAAALRTLASDPQRRSEMGAHGRARVVADFDVERTSEQLDHVFRTLLTPGGPVGDRGTVTGP